MGISIEDLFKAAARLDKRMVGHLVRAIKENDIKGFDYLEFKHSLNKLMAMGMGEETAIQSAFVTASTMGLTQEKLTKSAEHYNAVLKEEKGKFAEALKEQVHNRVEKRKKQVDELHAKIGEIEKKVEALIKNKAEIEQLIGKAQKEIDSSEEKIKSTQEKFLEAYAAFDDEIKTDIKTYKETLKSK